VILSICVVDHFTRFPVTMVVFSTLAALRFVTEWALSTPDCNIVRTAAVRAVPNSIDHVGVLTLSIFPLLFFPLELLLSLRTGNFVRHSTLSGNSNKRISFVVYFGLGRCGGIFQQSSTLDSPFNTRTRLENRWGVGRSLEKSSDFA